MKGYFCGFTPESDLKKAQAEMDEIKLLFENRAVSQRIGMAPGTYQTLQKFTDYLGDVQKGKESLEMFHFCGHGGNNSLEFQDTTGSSSNILNYLRDCPNLFFVFLNACNTLSGSEVLRKTVKNYPFPVMIVTTGDVDDEDAKKFAVNFYENFLKESETLGKAFQKAQNLISLKQGNKEFRIETSATRGVNTPESTPTADSVPTWYLIFADGFDYLKDKTFAEIKAKSSFLSFGSVIKEKLEDQWPNLNTNDEEPDVILDKLNLPFPIRDNLRFLLVGEYGDVRTLSPHDKVKNLTRAFVNISEFLNALFLAVEWDLKCNCTYNQICGCETAGSCKGLESPVLCKYPKLIEDERKFSLSFLQMKEISIQMLKPQSPIIIKKKFFKVFEEMDELEVKELQNVKDDFEKLQCDFDKLHFDEKPQKTRRFSSLESLKYEAKFSKIIKLIIQLCGHTIHIEYIDSAFNYKFGRNTTNRPIEYVTQSISLKDVVQKGSSLNEPKTSFSDHTSIKDSIYLKWDKAGNDTVGLDLRPFILFREDGKKIHLFALQSRDKISEDDHPNLSMWTYTTLGTEALKQKAILLPENGLGPLTELGKFQDLTKERFWKLHVRELRHFEKHLDENI